MATVEQTGSEQRFFMAGTDWQTYQSVLTAFGNRQIRVTYDRGKLELMSPSDVHERFKKLIDRLLAALSEELNIPLRSQGSTTFNNESIDRGLEPDECYYIQNEHRVRGRDEIDLAVDPPPDLALEIDITSSSINRMEIYAALGVPEVWRYDGNVLQVYQLESDGGYSETDQSLAFPSIPPAEIARHLTKRNELDETSWIREFRIWVRGLNADR